jgi:hypothetical protein
MLNTGRLAEFAFSRESNFFTDCEDDSLPFRSHPKLVAEASTQACTSATICADDHEYEPLPVTV